MSELTSPEHRHSHGAAIETVGGSAHALHLQKRRMCIGCRRSCARQDLVRLVATGDGKIGFDLIGAAWGRGAWVHPRPECVAKSVRNIARALRQPVSVTPSELYERLASAAWQRVASLMAAARRSGQLKIGIEAAGQCWAQLSLAGAQGRALVAPAEAAMGEWVGAQDVVLTSMGKSRLAVAIARNVAIAETFASARTNRGSDKGTEVG